MGKLRISSAGTPGAHPVTDTIGGKWIMIPGCLGITAGYPSNLSVPVLPHAAKPQSAIRDTTLVDTDSAPYTVLAAGRRFGESEMPTALPMPF